VEQALHRGADEPTKRSKTLKQKVVIGGVAALSATAIAAVPVTATSPAMLQAQQRSMTVDLVASVTDSPLDYYGQFFSTTQSNVTALAASIQANPLPLLSQVFENQKGYFDSFAAAVEGLPAKIETSFAEDGNVGKNLVKLQAALEAGDIFAAYEAFNAAFLYSFTVFVTPFSGLIFSSATAPGIIETAAQNMVDALGVLLDTTNINRGIFYSAFAVASGVPYEAARVVGSLVKAIQDGEIEEAGNVLLNAPAAIANALINGFDYNPDDPTAAWPGLFAPLGPEVPDRNGNLGPAHPGGLIYQALVGLPSQIADAINNNPAPASQLVNLKLQQDEQEALEDGTETVTEGEEAEVIEPIDAEVVELPAGDEVVAVAPVEAPVAETPAGEIEEVVTEVDVKKELADSAAEKPAESKAAAALTKSAEKAKANVAKVNERINSAAKKVGDGLKKLTGSKKDKASDSKSDSKSNNGGGAGDSGNDSD